MLLHCGTVCGWGLQKGKMPLVWHLADFQSLPLLPTSKLGPSGADSWVGGFVYILGPYGSLQWTLLWGWKFLPPPQSHRFFQSEVLRLYFPTLEPWVTVCLAPQVFLPVYPHTSMGLPTPPATTSLTWSSSCCLAECPLHPHCPSPPLLPIWMDVSSLTPWLSDLHTVWFSGSSGYFLFLNLLSFFRLREEATCICLCLHLGWKFLPYSCLSRPPMNAASGQLLSTLAYWTDTSMNQLQLLSFSISHL